MREIIQYRKVVALEYSLEKGEVKIKMEGTQDNYYFEIDKLTINPDNTDLGSLRVFQNEVFIIFSKPTICNVNSGRYFSSMRCGVDFEGDHEGELVEKLEGLASRLVSPSEE